MNCLTTFHLEVHDGGTGTGGWRVIGSSTDTGKSGFGEHDLRFLIAFSGGGSTWTDTTTVDHSTSASHEALFATPDFAAPSAPSVIGMEYDTGTGDGDKLKRRRERKDDEPRAKPGPA